jgi:hypothetical protein
VTTDDGIISRAAVPSGASTGMLFLVYNSRLMNQFLVFVLVFVISYIIWMIRIMLIEFRLAKIIIIEKSRDVREVSYQKIMVKQIIDLLLIASFFFSPFQEFMRPLN